MNWCRPDTSEATASPALPRTGYTDSPTVAWPQPRRDSTTPLREGLRRAYRSPDGVGCSEDEREGGDHGLLERRRTAAARQRAGAQEDRHGLARAAGRRHREGYELGKALLLGHERGGREARAPKAARANRRRSRLYWRIDRTIRPNRDMHR